MKLSEIMQIRGTLFKHKDDTAPLVSIATKYKITQFLFNTDSDAGFLESQLNSFKKQYFDEKGNVLEEKKEEYAIKIKELLETEVNKEIRFTIAELEHFDLSIDDIIKLNKCIIKNETEKGE